ncbi:MAG: glycosyltransferase [Candidatus Aenigmatarchaeota archaeon]
MRPPKHLPTITVLLTVKNNSSTIEACINSLVRQTYQKEKYVIFIVDAFSNDGTWEKLLRFKKKTKKPKIILTRKKGNPPTAYNYAIRNTHTDFVAFIDGDCVADKNWLLELVRPLLKKENQQIPGTAGIVLNPSKSENKLQEIIGNELEERYKHFPKKLLRAATMNLLIKTKLVKEIKFDTNLNVAYDTDFGYRLTKKYEKILYQKNAKIFHYHRSSWERFFKQQFKYATALPYLYTKHINKIRGDHVSTPIMMIQIVLAYFISIFSLLSVLSCFFLWLALFSIFILFNIWIINISRLPKKEPKDVFYYLGVFSLRLLAWFFGIFIGTLNLIKKRLR